MSQSKITTFVHNNLIATIIAALIIGGGLSALAFLAYNSGTKSVQDNVTATTVSPQSSSSVIKSSSVSSSTISSSVISSNSVQEVKKEVIKEIVKETPKTVEVEKPKVTNIETPKVSSEVKPIKFINSSDLTKVPEEDLGCFGRKTPGESAYKANYGNSYVILNNIQNIKTDDPNWKEGIDRFFDFLDSGMLYPKEDGSFLGKYDNPGYSFFGCSNYASGTNKLIPVEMKNVDKVRSYLSFGSQGGVPNPAIEIYVKRGSELLQISKYLSIGVEDISVECGGETGGISGDNLKCFYDKVSKVLTDQYLESKVKELVELYSIK